MGNPYLQTQLNLRNREFRLLQLQPSTERGKVACTLRTYPLGESPPYTALSYSWGPKQNYRNILLNDVSFPVGRNLWWFLVHMRLQEQHGLYWIDAICIDQSDVTEQNHQVQMMGSIYSRAQSVAIWLGEVDSSNNVAMQFIATRKPLGTRRLSFGEVWTLEQADSVLHLCNRNYWRRIWIVQEVMLAKKATIFCGSMHVNWYKLEGLINDLHRIFEMGLAHTRSAYLRCARGVLSSPAIVIAKAISTRSERKPSLVTLLEVYRHHEATDIRDKIYALHGLAEDTENLPIDYRTSPKELLSTLLRHATSGSSKSIKGRKELLRLGKMMAEILNVHCSDDEIDSYWNGASSSSSTVITSLRVTPEVPVPRSVKNGEILINAECSSVELGTSIKRSRVQGSFTRKHRKRLRRRLENHD